MFIDQATGLRVYAERSEASLVDQLRTFSMQFANVHSLRHRRSLAPLGIK